MPFYRTADGAGTMHLNFGGRRGPAPCVAFDADAPRHDARVRRCCRVSVALCDAPVGTDLTGEPLTCDAPICERHRTRVGVLDYCPRHRGLA